MMMRRYKVTIMNTCPGWFARLMLTRPGEMEEGETSNDWGAGTDGEDNAEAEWRFCRYERK